MKTVLGLIRLYAHQNEVTEVSGKVSYEKKFCINSVLGTYKVHCFYYHNDVI